MSPVIWEEARLFLLSLGAGFFLAVLYEVLRLFRRLLHHSLFARSLEDFCYWVFCGLFCFLLLFRENDGILRGFAIGGVILGMFVQERMIFPKISSIFWGVFHKKS